MTDAVEVVNAILTVCVIGHHRAAIGTRVYLGFGSVLFSLFLQLLLGGTHKPQFGYFRAVPAGKHIFISILGKEHITGKRSAIVLIPDYLPKLCLRVPSAILQFLRLSLRIELHGELQTVEKPGRETYPQLLTGEDIFLGKVNTRVPKAVGIPFFLGGCTVLILHLVRHFDSGDIRHDARSSGIDFIEDNHLLDGFLGSHIRVCINVGNTLGQH